MSISSDAIAAAPIAGFSGAFVTVPSDRVLVPNVGSRPTIAPILQGNTALLPFVTLRPTVAPVVRGTATMLVTVRGSNVIVPK